jgi:hypothetical protein
MGAKIICVHLLTIRSGKFMCRFIKVLQKDIVTKPEQWKDAGPGRFIKLSNKAKNVYSVLSVIAFSAVGNAKGKFARNGGKLGNAWFWASHAMLQQLTGSCQKTVQRAIKELNEAGFIGYHPAKKNGHQCFFKIKRIKYNFQQEDTPRSRVKPKRVKEKEPTLPGESDTPQKEMKEIEKKQKKPVKLDIPYKEGVLFKRGRDTHDEKTGWPLDKNGKSRAGCEFEDAEEIMENDGEEAFLEYVSKKNIENHLVPEYREKLTNLKN